MPKVSCGIKDRGYNAELTADIGMTEYIFDNGQADLIKTQGGVFYEGGVYCKIL